jgi:twinkle protein
MNKQLVHQPCPFRDCASSDAFSYWPDECTGYCHSCGVSYPSNKPLKDWAEEVYSKPERKVPVEQQTVSSVSYEGIRGLKPEVAELYGIQLQLDAQGKPVRYAFKYKDNVKYRGYSEKKFWVKERGRAILDLFGPPVNAGSSKRIYITEGEFDAASLFQTLGMTYPVLALPSASINEAFLKKNMPFLSTFQEVVYAGELDEAGKKAAERIYAAIPEKFYYVPLTKHKDANDFVMNGDSEDLKWAALKPQRYAPDNFFCTDEAVRKAITEENPYEYVPTGHTGWDNMCRGLVKGGITFIKAPRGTGKTELARFFEVAMLRSEGTKIGILHMEEMKSTTYRAMATYDLSVNVRTKDDAKWNNVDEKEVVSAAQRVAQDDRTIVFEMRAGDDPMKVLEYVRLAAAVYGADFIFIDHVQRLAYQSAQGVDGATAVLTSLGSQMAQLAKELNIGVVFISQVNDDGRTKYASALEEEAIICVLLERNVDSEDEIIQNTTHFKFDKNRPFSKLGSGGYVYFDPETMILTEKAA